MTAYAKEDWIRPDFNMKFDETYCSQCGEGFGPGDSGFSHCDQHAEEFECPACRGMGEVHSPEKRVWTHCKLCDGTGAVSEQVAKDWPAA